jgi:uncharacterized protein (DUF697 family)
MALVRRPLMLAREHCQQLVMKYAAGAGVGGLIPVPGTSMAVTAAEVKLVVDIAAAYGERIDDAGAVKLIGLSTVKNLGVKALGEAVGWVPLVGWAARPALFAASVKAVGDAAVRHYEALRPDAIYHH